MSPETSAKSKLINKSGCDGRDADRMTTINNAGGSVGNEGIYFRKLFDKSGPTSNKYIFVDIQQHTATLAIEAKLRHFKKLKPWEPDHYY